MRARWISLVVLSVSTLACGRTAAFEPLGGATSNADAGTGGDASAPADGGRVDAGTPPDASCTTALAPISTIGLYEPGQPFVIDAFPVGGGVAAVSRDDAVTAFVSLERGEARTIGSGVERLIDASERAVVGVEGGQLEVLYERSVVVTGPATLRGAALGTRPRHFAGDRLAICTQARELSLFDARAFEGRASTRVRSCPPLVYTGPRAILLGYDDPMVGGMYELWEPTSSAPKAMLGTAAGRLGGVIFGDDVYTLQLGQVVVQPLASPTRRDVFHPGPCAWIEANATHLVLGCGTSGMLSTVVKELEVYDGRTRTTIDTGGRAVLSPQLGDGFVAWLDYEDESALCNATPASGRLMVQDLVGGGAPTAFATLDAPCLCCGAFWPEPELVVRGDTVVYTYPSGVLAIPGRPHHAALVLRRQCR